MIKALEILIQGIGLMENTKYHNPSTLDHIEKEVDRYKEAVAELNQLMSKSCEQCTYSDEKLWCTYLANGTTVTPDFCCKAYAPKGE